MRFLTTSAGVEICIRDLGGSGQMALLVHGASFCGSVLTPLARLFADRYHCFAPDLRGHGSSSRPADLDYGWSSLGDDLAEVLDQLDGPIVGFGHSLGATALMLAAARRPGKVAALCCYEPVLLGGSGGLEASEGIAARSERRIATFPSTAAARDRLRSKPPLDRLLPEAFEAYLADGFDHLPDGSLTLALPNSDEAALYRAARTADFDDEISTIACPVTLLVGESDGGRALGADRVQRAIPHARLVELPDFGHFAPLEDPETIAALTITAFDTAGA